MPDMMLSVVLDTPDFMVVNKAAGVPMHDNENAIILLAQRLFSIDKLWLVHRLDTGTSGCILLAKSKTAASELSQQFANRQVQKYYFALIDRKPKKKQGSVIGDMKKARNGDWKLSNELENPAHTQFFSYPLPRSELVTQKTHDTDPIAPAHRVCILKPISGKTHQLRVALKSLSAPIVGDRRYKGTPSDRMYLHSYAIQFSYQNVQHTACCWPQSGTLFQTISDMISHFSEPWLLQWPRHTK